MKEFLVQNQLIAIIASLWTLPWKGVALWKAAKNSHKYWFIAIPHNPQLHNPQLFCGWLFKTHKTHKLSTSIHKFVDSTT